MGETDYRLLLTTEGYWYDSIASGEKKFDFRKGIRDFNIGTVVCFMESSIEGVLTGKVCTAVVNMVIKSSDFPEHFGWKGGDFTIIQFGLIGCEKD